MKRILAVLPLAAALLLTNCAPSTPQARIDQNYSLYESLPSKHQELVRQGRLAKGMSKDAVYLALGSPSRKSEGFRNNAPYERWDYTRLQPHYYQSFYTHYGHGWGRRGHRYGGFGFGPTVEYIPYRASSVMFRHNKVDSWERFTPYRY